MKLSVVIPAYNEEESISETLRSLYATLKKYDIPHEIWVTNDNSKDNTLGVLQALQKDSLISADGFITKQHPISNFFIR